MLNTKLTYRISCTVIFSFFIWQILKSGWLSDDAQITLRSVMNFLSGFGPNFNCDERVQAFTHPLWFMCLACMTFIVRNAYYATFALSISLSSLALYLFLTKISPYAKSVILASLCLVFSKAYLDYSTSGLENPLSHILLLVLVLLAEKITENNLSSRKNLSGYFLCCAFLYLNRPDLSLLILPLTLWVCKRNLAQFGALVSSLCIGAIPALIWTGFSLYYYGFPFPNTAYAKLGITVPIGWRIHHGVYYLLNSLKMDPLTLITIAVGVVASVFSSALNRKIAWGIVLYLAYTVSIGGDFMSGRFLTETLLAAAIIIARCRWSKKYLWLFAISITCITVGEIIHNASVDRSHLQLRFDHGIADERLYYDSKFQVTSYKMAELFALNQWKTKNQGVKIIECGILGYQSISAGPGMHFSDQCALADPLLARIPSQGNEHDWRIGHILHNIPAGYYESLQQNQNMLIDPQLHEYYDKIRLITRSPLNSRGRLHAIIELNLHKRARISSEYK